METVGRLAAGVAHEINTPVQYVGGNLSFLEDAFSDLNALLEAYEKLLSAIEADRPLVNEVQAVKQYTANIDFASLQEEIPKAVDQSLEGIRRVSQIIRSMKEFAHPETRSKTSSDVNRIIESMVTVSTGEWKPAAELVMDLDQTLPAVAVLPGEFGQVICNLLINAAQAIAEVNDQLGEKGTIAISTRCDEDHVEIRIRDTGPGIPEEYRSQIYDQFFTTKSVGVGTGQGLAMAYAMIVNEHGGTIDFVNGQTSGTTFIIRLPIGTMAESQEVQQREAAYSLHRR
ncbi:MAG: sensor histidine kinase [Aeoliella sp.]